MYSVVHPQLNELLSSILAVMQNTRGQRLVGLYLYGAFDTGDFDEQVSGLDFLAVTPIDLMQQDLEALKLMHDDLVLLSPAWEGWLEVAYLSIEALRTFKSQTSRMAVISPEQPFHVKDDAQATALSAVKKMCTG